MYAYVDFLHCAYLLPDLPLPLAIPPTASLPLPPSHSCWAAGAPSAWWMRPWRPAIHGHGALPRQSCQDDGTKVSTSALGGGLEGEQSVEEVQQQYCVIRV